MTHNTTRTHVITRLCAAALIAATTFLAGATPARAEPEATFMYIVDRFDDPAVGASTCDDLADNDCSLRGAITKANAGAGGNTYQIIFKTNYDINLSSPLPLITQSNVSISAINGCWSPFS